MLSEGHSSDIHWFQYSYVETIHFNIYITYINTDIKTIRLGNIIYTYIWRVIWLTFEHNFYNCSIIKLLHIR